MFIIAGLYRRQRLAAPKSTQTRPTANRLREALFNICQHRIENARFLDLFAGSGAMGLEALSRGAQSATFIDSQKEAIECIEKNVDGLHVRNQSLILKGEVFRMLNWLKRQGQVFDIIFADPPYATHVPGTAFFYSQQIIAWLDAHGLIQPSGLLFVEEDFHHSPKMPELKTLQLIDERRLGPAMLQQYQQSPQGA